MPFEYLAVLVVSLAGPLIFSFSRELTFYRSPARLVLSIVIPFVIFVLWDILVTGRGHWSFNPDYTLGITIVNLPIEEILFFVVIPFCALFTWESVKYFLRQRK